MEADLGTHSYRVHFYRYLTDRWSNRFEFGELRFGWRDVYRTSISPEIGDSSGSFTLKAPNRLRRREM
jgi:hypothetical protein